MKTIPMDQWKWFGHPGHFICAQWCRFHLCTLVGDHLISTVGEYLPCGTCANERAEAEYLLFRGFHEIGCDRLFETYVFKITGKVCKRKGCMCGLPEIKGGEIDGIGCNTAAEATANHMEMCKKYAAGIRAAHGA